MSETNYPLSFYVIQMGVNRYDLYNLSTDNCILKGKDKETIKTFFDINDPNHPFLVRFNRSWPESVTMGYESDNTNPSNTFTYTLSDPYLNDKDGGDLSKYSFYCGSFDNSNSDYCSGLSDEEVGVNKKNPYQLEFDFTSNKEMNKNNETTEDTSDLPYLGDNED